MSELSQEYEPLGVSFVYRLDLRDVLRRRLDSLVAVPAREGQTGR